ncbi:U32 family peptidase [Limisphaera ngatamarikiensis]|uniref:U32 family peptidase n=1 Tax=Limisphaera ngatamarikiensis TaxID=1324935 RepID=UPI0031B80F5B
MPECRVPPARPAWLPELLAPAGDWDCVRAAVENGADAIYFGLELFNARMRARNFTVEELPALMEWLHLRGVRGYVTFNTLVFEPELPQAEALLRAMMVAGVDAVVVQDVGVARLVRMLSPDFPMHASTQMTITSAAGVDLARELGCQLVVLARECSIPEIRRIQETQARHPAGRPLPLEVFVHGALCVAYSGQCLTSESLGQRSANRGECAQACRLPYGLVADDRPVPLGDRQYLLSPQDLMGLELLPELIRAGVASLKIEGRLKSPEYVANVTRAYRQALDRLAAMARTPEELPPVWNVDPETRYGLEMAFSRGLYTGWLRGIDNQALVHGRFGKKRGVYLGEVVRVENGSVILAAVGPVRPGDGVVFDAGHPEVEEEGGRVHAVEPVGRDGSDVARLRLRFGHGTIRWARVRPGQKVWKTSDPALERSWRRSFEGDQPRYCRPVIMRVRGQAGAPMELCVTDEQGRSVTVRSALRLEPARDRPLTPEVLQEQLGRLGGTPFYLAGLECALEGSVLLPFRELNRLRREAVAQLERLRKEPPRWTVRAEPVTGPRTRDEVSADGPAPAPGVPAGPALTVLVRSMEQLDAALNWGAETIYCDFENPKQYPAAVERVRRINAGRSRPATIWVAGPRICKPGEEWILRQLAASRADGFLVRNADQLYHFHGQRCVGDATLNVANHLAAAFFLERFGVERVTASYDLDADQLEALVRALPPGRVEVTLHQHMPMFHMEHCVFCAFLSQGHDYRDCGRPCEKHRVQLRDRVGALHPVKADAGCRNTVFNARAQTGAEYAGRLIRAGVRHFRIEFVEEPGDEVVRTLSRYAALLRGEIDGETLWRELRLVHQLGVTRGTLRRG